MDRAFDALTEQSESFRNALLATQDAVMTHSIGKTREADTVLTQREFLLEINEDPGTFACCLSCEISTLRIGNRGGEEFGRLISEAVALEASEG